MTAGVCKNGQMDERVSQVSAFIKIQLRLHFPNFSIQKNRNSWPRRLLMSIQSTIRTHSKNKGLQHHLQRETDLPPKKRKRNYLNVITRSHYKRLVLAQTLQRLVMTSAGCSAKNKAH